MPVATETASLPRRPTPVTLPRSSALGNRCSVVDPLTPAYLPASGRRLLAVLGSIPRAPSSPPRRSTLLNKPFPPVGQDRGLSHQRLRGRAPCQKARPPSPALIAASGRLVPNRVKTSL